MLDPVEFPSELNSIPIPDDVAARLAQVRARIEAFQDCWQQHHAAQFVAADYELVYQSLTWIGATQIFAGRRFLEWGAGFSAVACLAGELGWAAYAVEAHPDLIPQAQNTIRLWPDADVELVEGNFLPETAHELAFDPTLPSLGHGGEPAYGGWEMELDDFSLIYSYPWPGEDEFHEDVFDAFAAVGAMLLMFIGPNEMRAWRKTG